MPLGTIVFIDAQNTYLTAREAFGWELESSRRGNFRALALGDMLCATCRDDLELKQVRVYTGIPSQQRDEVGYRAARKRFDTWKQEGRGKVVVYERNLDYPPEGKPREKGIDVLLAIHMARLAGARAFERVILLSADKDLVPALELVCDVFGDSGVVEAIGLAPEAGCVSAPTLGVSTAERAQIGRRQISKADYERVEDQRSYNPLNPASMTNKIGPAPGQSGRQLPTHRTD